MAQLFANNGLSSLASAITANATTVFVEPSTAGSLPQTVLTTDYFMLTLEDRTQTPPQREIVRCTARLGNQLTVVRAQEGTPAQAFAAGVTVSHRITAGALTSLVVSILADLKHYPGVLRVITNLDAPADDDGVSYEDGEYGIYTRTSVLFRRTDGAWGAPFTYADIGGIFPNVPATDITGQLTDAQISALDTTKLIGQLTDAQIQAISAAKLTGQITETQITDGSISTPKLAAGAVATANLAAGAVVAGSIAASAIVASKIAAGQIFASHLNAADVVANFLKAESAYVGSAQIESLAVTNAHIADLSVDQLKLADGAALTAKIGLNAVSNVAVGTGGGSSADASIISAAATDQVLIQAYAIVNSSSAQVITVKRTFFVGGAPQVFTLFSSPATAVNTGGGFPIAVVAADSPYAANPGVDSNLYNYEVSCTSGLGCYIIVTKLQR